MGRSERRQNSCLVPVHPALMATLAAAAVTIDAGLAYEYILVYISTNVLRKRESRQGRWAHLFV